jgi:hypothetical protein
MPVIPVTQETEVRRVVAYSQRGQKVSEMPFQSISWAWWCRPLLTAMWEMKIGRLVSKATLGKHMRPPLKNN